MVAIKNSNQLNQMAFLPEIHNKKHVYQKKKAVGLHDKAGHYLHRNKTGKHKHKWWIHCSLQQEIHQEF